MAHTLEPWSTKYKMVKVFGNIDNNELAARLRGVNTFDRRGNVYWVTTFNEDLHNFFIFDSGSDEEIYLSNERVYTGDSSLKMIPATTSPYQCLIYRYLPVPSDLSIGVETWIAMPDDGDNILVQANFCDGTNNYPTQVEIDINNERLEYGQPGSMNNVTGGSYNLIEDTHFFYPMKFVIDWENKEWKRIMFAETQYNVSGTAISSSGAGTEPYTRIGIRAEADDGKTAEFFIGTVIMTIQEP